MGSPEPRLSFLYSLLCRKDDDGKLVVLSEYATTTGNFQTVARKMFGKVDFSKDQKMAFSANTHVFDVVIADKVAFLVMTPALELEGKRRLTFAYLDDIRNCFKQRFQARYNSANPSECYEPFALILRQKMETYSKNPPQSHPEQIRKEIQETTDIMMQNVDEMLARGEKVSLLVEKTDDLTDAAQTFHRRAEDLKSKMWWRNCKMMALIGIPIVLGIFWIIFWLCGGISFCNCSKKGCLSQASQASSLLQTGPGQLFAIGDQTTQMASAEQSFRD